MPTPIAGVKPLNGKRKPPSVVASVVIRKIAVVTGSRLPANNPPTTTSPVAMPITLRITWRIV